ncbi:MAG TPA: iron-containing redox enzyme family protein [Acidisarcina sp.]
MEPIRTSTESLWTRVDALLARYDLLQHPFYQAWSAGELTHDQLAAYGAQYLPHVAAFPTYLTALHSRLPEGRARKAILANAADEESHGRSHADIWRQFIAGMRAFDTDQPLGGSARESGPGAAGSDEVLPEIRELVSGYQTIARDASLPTALGAFYAYESQVPRVAASKLAGLKEHYSADDASCEYFALHTTADVYHSKVWKSLIEDCVAGDPSCAAQVLSGAEEGARALWRALDGIEAVRVKALSN